MRIATGTSSWSSPSPTPETSRSRSPPSTGGRRRPRCTSCRTSGSATPGGWTTAARAEPHSARRPPQGLRHRRQHPARSGSAFSTATVRSICLFTDNETNRYRLWGQPNPTQYQKDGINDYVVQGRKDAVNPGKKGTKSAAHTLSTRRPGQSATVTLAPAPTGRPAISPIRSRSSTRPSPTGSARRTSSTRRSRPPSLSEDAASVVRQGYAGLLWTKQAYVYDVERVARRRARHPRRDSGGPTPQPALVPHVQRRRHLDARQVGVPLVRRLGSGLSLGGAGVVDPEFAQGSAVAHAARTVPAPQRPAPRLRVELRRRQPARPRLGGAVQLSGQPAEPRATTRSPS